jgi:hypothetical protein
MSRQSALESELAAVHTRLIRNSLASPVHQTTLPPAVEKAGKENEEIPLSVYVLDDGGLGASNVKYDSLLRNAVTDTARASPEAVHVVVSTETGSIMCAVHPESGGSGGKKQKGGLKGGGGADQKQSGINAGRIIKQILEPHGGKGGGGPNLAEGFLPVELLTSSAATVGGVDTDILLQGLRRAETA